MKKAIIFLADGFEEIEALATADILRRGGVDLCLASIGNDLLVHGAHDLNVSADARLGDIPDPLAFDAYILPGGLGGMNNLKASPVVIDILKRANEDRRIVAAICASPIVLHAADVIKGRTFTCYPSCEEGISSGQYTDGASVVRDGNLITSRGPGTTFAFAFKLLEALASGDVAESVADAMLAPIE